MTNLSMTLSTLLLPKVIKWREQIVTVIHSPMMQPLRLLHNCKKRKLRSSKKSTKNGNTSG